nr:MAG TPA: hypothetical protein [Caudoviricetes sp.]
MHCAARVAYSPLNALFQSNFIGLRLLSRKKHGSGAWGRERPTNPNSKMKS